MIALEAGIRALVDFHVTPPLGSSMPLEEAGGGQFEIDSAEGGSVRWQWQCLRREV